MRAWILLAGLWPLLGAAEIYRWTDDTGQVHFGERPGAASAERIEVRPQVIERDPAAQAQQDRAARWFDARREERQSARQQAADQRAGREQECGQLKHQLATLSSGGRYFSVDADGERNYYSEEQLQAARQALTDRISGSCP